MTLRQINATESDAQLYARLAGSVIYANASLRAEAGVLLRNRRGQSGLWSYAISGDLPIVLLQIGDAENIDLVRQLVQAHAYWRLKGLAVDLVIWNEDRGGYRQVLQDQIMGLIAAGIEAHVIDRPGGIFVRRAEQIVGRGPHPAPVGGARDHHRPPRKPRRADRRAAVPAEVRVPRLVPTPRPSRRSAVRRTARARADPLQRPRRIHARRRRVRHHDCAPDETTPAPWVNVLANPHFGTVVSESGLAYTWSENAHEFRLTPWHNDPVSDASGEAFYLRDEETGHFWSPTPLPRRGAGAYVTRHGFGYSVFEHVEDGIALRALASTWRIDAAGEVLGAQGSQRVGPAAPALGHRLRGVGARRPAAEDRDARGHRNRRRRAARCSRATPTTPSSPTASRSSTSTTRRAP